MKYGYEGITDFIFMNDELIEADVILIPGGSHKELAIEAANLYRRGFAKYILPSGNINKKLESHDTEYDFLKEVLINEGVPKDNILKEDKAKHTFDNAQLSLEVLQAENIVFDKVILVCKNYHSRRVYLTYKIYFPKNVDFRVCGIVDGTGISRDNWFNSDEKIKKVLTEVIKIGKYFENYIKDLGENL